MNIDKLTDQKKSVMLARVMGWEIHPVIGQHIIHTLIHNVVVGDEIIGNMLGDELNLYDPANMALAWRVLNWAIVSPWNNVIGYTFTGNVAILRMFEDAKMIKLSPADAQRAWLDKVLSLAIEAGLIPA